jgi:hypothetical protein
MWETIELMQAVDLSYYKCHTKGMIYTEIRLSGHPTIVAERVNDFAEELKQLIEKYQVQVQS